MPYAARRRSFSSLLCDESLGETVALSDGGAHAEKVPADAEDDRSTSDGGEGCCIHAPQTGAAPRPFTTPVAPDSIARWTSRPNAVPAGRAWRAHLSHRNASAWTRTA
jgi:hypothetical protein